MRSDIDRFFASTKEATGKQIAARIGADAVEIAKELNRMLAEGLVERAKQGAGNEYTWWPVAAHVAPVSKSAGAFVEVLRQVEAESDAAQQPSVEQDPSVPADDPDFAEVDQPISLLWDLIDPDLSRAETPVRDAMRILKMRSEFIQRLQGEHARLLEANERLRGNNAVLERKIDELTIVDAEFIPPALFVTVGRYSPAKRHTTLEKAQRRASQLVRSEKEAEVLVCEPVGRVVRGSEWRQI